MPFPGWAGETVLIAASGPSQRKEDIARAKGKAKVIVINETWRLAPWADLLYACDERWWRTRGPSKDEFKGLRYIGAATYQDCIPCGVRGGFTALKWDGQTLGAGGNSGFQAINLAAVAGAKTIVLTGFDMKWGGTKKHWHADHGGELTNPEQRMLSNCRKILDGAAAELSGRGIHVVNCSRETALQNYPRAHIKDVFT